MGSEMCIRDSGATPQQAQTMVNRQTEGVDAVVSKINEFVQQSVGSMTVRDLLTDDVPTASRSDQTQDATAVPKPDPMKD